MRLYDARGDLLRDYARRNVALPPHAVSERCRRRQIHSFA